MPIFALMTLLPYALLSLAAVQGGVWVWLALGFMAVFAALLDRIIAITAPNTPKEAEFPAATPLLIVLGVGHFALFALTLWAVAGPSAHGFGERISIAVTAGLIFGQIAHPVAHELIHRKRRVWHRLGQLVYTSLTAGHHASAHLLIHHIHVGSDQDPNSPPKGEPFHRFALRAGRASFRAGFNAETERRNRAGKPAWSHPFVIYVGGAIAFFLASVWTFGLPGAVAYIAIASHAKLQIFLSDYVQHYGLRRAVLPNGRLEPVGPQHSWNAPDLFSSALMVNAPRHSDHHVTPNRPYPALQLQPDAMPMLPYPLPIMGAIAMMPRLWFRLMNPRCDVWQTPNAAPHGDGLPAQS